MFLPLVSIIVHAFYFGTPENEWRELFWSYLPDWLTINDPERASRLLLSVRHRFLKTHYLMQWMRSQRSGGVLFTFALIFVMQCINVDYP